MVQMAAYSPEAAAECFYCIPRGGLDIYGPSVRLSEIVAYCWGNLYSVSRVIDINAGSRMVTAQAIAWDLEANVKEGIEYTQRITVKGPEGQKVAALAAVAMAGRNAKLKLVPRVVWFPVYMKCLDVARGDVIPLGDRIARMIKAFAVWGITIDRILAKFGYENVTQFKENDLPALIGYHTSLKEEAASPEEIFPRAGSEYVGTSGPGQSAQDHTANQATESGPEAKREALRERSGSATDDPAGSVSAGPGNESASPRRRGRPPGSGRKSESAPATGSVSVPSPATDYGPSATLDSGGDATIPDFPQFPAEEAPKAEPEKAPEGPKDAKKELADKLRALCQAADKKEGALMARLREWGFGKNLSSEPIRLEDYEENTLLQVIERWSDLVRRGVI